MTSFKNPVTGHEVTTDGESEDFWKAAGYAPVAAPKPKKAPAKKAASSKSEK